MSDYKEEMHRHGKELYNFVISKIILFLSDN